jgi:peptide-methionine (R)-S-oxide reductase
MGPYAEKSAPEEALKKAHYKNNRKQFLQKTACLVIVHKSARPSITINLTFGEDLAMRARLACGHLFVDEEFIMQTRRRFLLTSAATAVAAAFAGRFRAFAASSTSNTASQETFEVVHSEAEWRKLLGPMQFEVLRREGTERPYTSALNDEHRPGTFACAGCRLPVFSSSTKFDSHTGWPSFWAPLNKAVATRVDGSFGVMRTEVHCRRCGGHLGHVFDDGPKPTGLRYCMNGIAMNFNPGAA